MKKILISFAFALISVVSFAQNSVGIGTTAPDTKAILDLQSTDQGVLVPRMTSAQRTAIAGLTITQNGLLIYDTDLNAFQFWNGSTWNGLGGADTDWIENNDTIYNNTHFVAIGANWTLDYVRLFVESDGVQTAIAGSSDGDGTRAIGVEGFATNSSTNIGMLAQGVSTTVNDTTVGVLGQADLLDGGRGIGVIGEVSEAKNDFATGVEGTVDVNLAAINGDFTGGDFTVIDDGTNNSSFGVSGDAFNNSGGTTGIAIGVYGTADGALENFAGYFAEGNVHIENNLGIKAIDPISSFQLGTQFHIDTAFGGSYTLFGNNLTYNGSDFIRTRAGTGQMIFMGDEEFQVQLFGNGAAGSGTNFDDTTRFSLKWDGARITVKNEVSSDYALEIEGANRNGLLLRSDSLGISIPSSLGFSSNDNTIRITTLDNLSNSYTLTLPDGLPTTAGDVLTSDLAGNLYWSSPSGGSPNIYTNDGTITGVRTLTLNGTNSLTYDIAGTGNMIFDMTSTGDFFINTGGTNAFFVNNIGDAYIGAAAGSSNDLYISDRIIDRDDAIYYLNPNETSVLNLLDVNGVITNSGGNYGGNVAMLDNIVPQTNGFFDIGSSANQWRDLRISRRIHLAGSNSGNSGQVLTSGGGAGNAYWSTPATSNPSWELTGNTGTVNGTNFLGTIDAVDLDIRTNNVIRHRFTQKGQLEFINVGNSVFIGEEAGNANTSGVNNVANGYQSLASNTTGSYNVATGYQSLNSNIIGVSNTAIGRGALLSSNADRNTAVGHYSMPNTTTGGQNTSVGAQALNGNVSGNNNTSVGVYSLFGNFNGDFNTAIGKDAGDGNQTGDYNTYLGYNADGNSTLLSNSTAIGANSTVIASDRVKLGNNADVEFDRALMPNNIAGNSGDILVSQGGGIAPLWQSAANASANIYNTDGLLTAARTVTHGVNTLIHNLNSTGDFKIQDAGVTTFEVRDNGITFFGGDTYWRDESTAGTNLASLVDDGNDGRFRIYENGGISIDLNANTQFIFNEQGFDRNFRVESNNESNMLFVDGGLDRIGIGTSLPINSLSIHKNGFSKANIYSHTNSTNSGGTISLGYAGGTGAVKTAAVSSASLGSLQFDGWNGTAWESAGWISMRTTELWDATGTGAEMSFYTNPNNSTANFERMKIHQDGDVEIITELGVGVKPMYPLHIVSNTSTRGIYSSNTRASGGYGIYARSSGASGSKYGVYGYGIGTGTANYGIYGRSSNSATNNYGIYGYVSGSTNNAYAVYGKTATNAATTFAGFFDGNTKVQHFNNSTWGGLYIKNESSLNNWRFYQESSGSGNDMRMYYGVNLRGTFSSLNGVYSPSSDIHLKKNIENVKNVLDDVMKMRIVNYHFKDNKDSDRKTIGLIAQEIKEIFPNVVTGGTNDPEDKDSNLLGLEYSSLSVLSFKAIQEQQTQIEALKKENENLKTELDKIKKHLGIE